MMVAGFAKRALRNEYWAGIAVSEGLGHRNIPRTLRYTALAPDSSKNFWRR
jgi:hypothetical protein